MTTFGIGNAARAMLALALCALCAICALAGAATPAGAQARGAFVVIVGDASPVRSVKREQLSRIFLKKETRLPGGGDAVPVDLDARSPVRSEFVGAVHRKSVAAINSYWHTLIFAGRQVPPRTVATEREVVAFVRDTPGAVGYVSSGFELGRGVRVVRLEE